MKKIRTHEIAMGILLCRNQCLCQVSEANGNFHQLEAHKCEHAIYAYTGFIITIIETERKQIPANSVPIDILFVLVSFLSQRRKFDVTFIWWIII